MVHVLSINACFGKKLNQHSLCQVHLHYILCSITLKLSLQTRSRAELNLVSGFFLCLVMLCRGHWLYSVFSHRRKFGIHNTISPKTDLLPCWPISSLKTTELFFLLTVSLHMLLPLSWPIFTPLFSIIHPANYYSFFRCQLKYHSL